MGDAPKVSEKTVEVVKCVVCVNVRAARETAYRTWAWKDKCGLASGSARDEAT